MIGVFIAQTRGCQTNLSLCFCPRSRSLYRVVFVVRRRCLVETESCDGEVKGYLYYLLGKSTSYKEERGYAQELAFLLQKWVPLDNIS